MMFFLKIFKGRAFGIAVIAVVFLAFFVVSTTPGARAERCVPSCVEPKICKGVYADGGGQYKCVCRWGKLEVGLLSAKKGTDICALIEDQGSGKGAIVWLVQQAVVAMMALTVMAGLIILVASGYIYMTAGGDASRVQKAKVWMGSSIAGIVLALLGYTLLRLIAYNLVIFG